MIVLQQIINKTDTIINLRSSRLPPSIPITPNKPENLYKLYKNILLEEDKFNIRSQTNILDDTIIKLNNNKKEEIVINSFEENYRLIPNTNDFFIILNNITGEQITESSPNQEFNKLKTHQIDRILEIIETPIIIKKIHQYKDYIQLDTENSEYIKLYNSNYSLETTNHYSINKIVNTTQILYTIKHKNLMDGDHFYYIRLYNNYGLYLQKEIIHNIDLKLPKITYKSQITTTNNPNIIFKVILKDGIDIKLFEQNNEITHLFIISKTNTNIDEYTYTFTKILPYQQSGNYSIIIKGYDNQNNIVTDNINLVIDLSGPLIKNKAITTPSNNNLPKIEIIAKNATNIEFYNNDYTINNSHHYYIVKQSINLNEMKFIVSLNNPLTDGNHKLYFIINDIYNNITTDSIEIDIDTTPPTIISSKQLTAININKPTIEILASRDTKLVKLYLDSSYNQEVTDKFSITLTRQEDNTIINCHKKTALLDGVYRYYIGVFDNYLNHAQVTLDLTIDTTPPTIISSKQLTAININKPTIEILASRDTKLVKLYLDSSYNQEVTDKFSITLTRQEDNTIINCHKKTALLDGVYRYYIGVFDNYLNHAQVTLDLTIDTTPPTIISSKQLSPITNSYITFEIISNNANYVEIYQDINYNKNVTIEYNINIVNNIFTINSLKPFSDGEFNIYFKIYDKYSNFINSLIPIIVNAEPIYITDKQVLTSETNPTTQLLIKTTKNGKSIELFDNSNYNSKIDQLYEIRKEKLDTNTISYSLNKYNPYEVDGFYTIYFRIYNTSNLFVDDSIQFNIDAYLPIINITIPINTPTNNNTPEFYYTSNKNARLSANFSFENDNKVVIGSNKIILTKLEDGTYREYYIEVMDKYLRTSRVLLPEFIINTINILILEKNKTNLNYGKVRIDITISNGINKITNVELYNDKNFKYNITNLFNIERINNTFTFTNKNTYPSGSYDIFIKAFNQDNTDIDITEIILEINNTPELYPIAFNKPLHKNIHDIIYNLRWSIYDNVIKNHKLIYPSI